MCDCHKAGQWAQYAFRAQMVALSKAAPYGWQNMLAGIYTEAKRMCEAEELRVNG